MELSKKQKDALQSCEQRPHNLPLVEASNAQEKKVCCSNFYVIYIYIYIFFFFFFFFFFCVCMKKAGNLVSTPDM